MPRSSGRRERLLTGVAVLVFVVATVYGVSGLDLRVDDVRWWAVAALLVLGVPTSTLTNAAEFLVSGRLLGQHHSLQRGLRVAVLGVAANILPIPGGALVRIAMLKRGGATTARATGVTFVAASVWASATAVVAGSLFIAIDPAVGWTAVGLGLAGFVVSVVLAHWRLRPPELASGMALLIVVEVASVTVGALRFWLVLTGVGQSVDLGQAAALTVAGVVATASGILPGGLGLREVLAAAIGPLVDLPARVALSAAAGNRIAEYLVLGPVGALLSLRPDPAVREAVEEEAAAREAEEQPRDDEETV